MLIAYLYISALLAASNIPITFRRLYYNIRVVVFAGYKLAQLDEALCYKPEGRGFDSRWFHCPFH